MATRHSPASLRNRDPILKILQPILQTGDHILEIASGSGEHACYFCQARPDINWQPSDPDPIARASIQAWQQHYGLTNLAAPLGLDVTSDWLLTRFSGIVCINMIHISPWQASLKLLSQSQKHLPIGGFLFIYGPFFERDVAPAPSNLDFDQSLQQRDPSWGIRQKEDLVRAAETCGLGLEQRWPMPANNIALLFRRLS